MCTSWAKVEQHRLTWHRMHQDILRGDLYQGLQDAVRDGATSSHLDALDIFLICVFWGGDNDLKSNVHLPLNGWQEDHLGEQLHRWSAAFAAGVSRRDGHRAEAWEG